MPLPLPVLDDRRWSDLVAEGQSLIPLYAPGWTDWNTSDPGVTLVELLAWHAELDLYWLNRVPVERLRKFLAVAGMAPHPPRAARVVAAFTPGPAAVALPADLEIAGTDLAGVKTVFRTLQPLTVATRLYSLAAVQVAAAPGAGAGGTAAALFADLSTRWRRGLPLALLGDDPRPGAALYLGFDAAPPAGQPLSLYFSFAFPAPGADGAVALPPHPSVRLAWEVGVAPGVWRQLDAAAGGVADDTRSLTLDGGVVLTLPAAPVAQGLGAVKGALYYLRCRLSGGAFDAAPVAADLAVNGVLAEQAEAPPVAVIAAQPAPVPPAVGTLLGIGDGRPHQRLSLPLAPVVDRTLELLSVEGGALRRWWPRFDFDASRRDDAHVVVDLQLGQVTCGDGEAGRTIPAGAPFFARYLATRGAGGNLPARQLNAILATAHNLALFGVADATALAVRLGGAGVQNPLPAAGGADAESEPAAAVRTATDFGTTPRAITLADYERLALATPGARVARATAMANLDPALPCLQATGVVTVIVLPWLPLGAPVPSAGLLRAVAAHLDRRRMIGTRIAVTGPTYRTVTVQVTVQALPHVDAAALAARAAAALDAFFHPLTGGPAGTGWPFGRAVYRAEVLRVLSEVPGLDSVSALALVLGDGTAVCGNVCLAPTELPAAGSHAIQVA